jgi:hypothetical protein
MNAVKFYGRAAWFCLREEWSSIFVTFSSYLLYPVLVWIFSKLWLSLNHGTSSLGDSGLFAYIGLTEILFITALMPSAVDRSSSDFALSFIRPRSWLLFTFVCTYSKVLSKRLGLLVLFFLVQSMSMSIEITTRFLVFLPFITMIDVLYSLIMISMQIRVYAIRNFKRLFGKIFLIFGGVFTPFCDISEKWQSFFLSTPFSDLIFQPCYYSLKGSFYGISGSDWFLRISIQTTILIGLTHLVYQNSRKHYHNVGG